ncbi:MAG: hypothetical protein WCK99_01890, partial [Mycobacteriaceae bacterium]
MNSSTVRKPGLIAAAAAVSVMIAIGIPLAIAAPTSAPPSDGQGYVDSTARCTKPEIAVIFGSTETSRVAICKSAAGAFEYRGVRVRDGAKLIVVASQTSDGGYIATNDGVTYTVTAQELSVSISGDTVRTESWTDLHSPQSPAIQTSATTKSSAATSSAPTTSATSSTASATASATSSTASSATSSTPQTSAAHTNSTVPLPPPLPAEAGGSTSPGR